MTFRIESLKTIVQPGREKQETLFVCVSDGGLPGSVELVDPAYCDSDLVQFDGRRVTISIDFIELAKTVSPVAEDLGNGSVRYTFQAASPRFRHSIFILSEPAPTKKDEPARADQLVQQIKKPPRHTSTQQTSVRIAVDGAILIGHLPVGQISNVVRHHTKIELLNLLFFDWAGSLPNMAVLS